MEAETKVKIIKELEIARLSIVEAIDKLHRDVNPSYQLHMARVYASNAEIMHNNTLPDDLNELIDNCAHSDLDPMEGCLDCGKAYHEVANMDPDLDMDR